MAREIPLKLKYRVSRSFKFGRYKPRTGNSHPPRRPGWVCRIRACGPIWSAPGPQKKD